MLLEDTLENQVSVGKGVRVADGAQADIFCRPRTNALGLAQRAAQRQRVLSFAQRNIAVQHAPGEIADRLFSLRRGSHLGQIAACQHFRAGKQTRVGAGQGVNDFFAVALNQLPNELAALLGGNELT